MSHNEAPGQPHDTSRGRGVAPGQPMAAPGAFIADPAPLGLAGFAMTTMVLSVVLTNMISSNELGVVFGLALAYGGIAQFAAGLWEFAKGNTFGATAFCSYGGFWISWWWITSHNTTGFTTTGEAVYLLAWGIFTLYMAIAASRVSLAVLAVFVLLTATYIILAIADFRSGSSTITKIGGWFGLATAVAAWYASFAGVTTFTFQRALVPTGPRR